MKKLIFISFTLLLTFYAVYGQSSKKTKSSVEPDLIPFRPIKAKVLDIGGLNKLIGYWMSLDGNAILNIKRSGNEILVSGDYFPGVSKYGDKAILSIKKDIDTNSGSNLSLSYTLSKSNGGGGGGADIVYYHSDEHLIVGKPPSKVFQDGEWWVSTGTYSSEGIYGKEFKRIK